MITTLQEKTLKLSSIAQSITEAVATLKSVENTNANLSQNLDFLYDHEDISINMPEVESMDEEEILEINTIRQIICEAKSRYTMGITDAVTLTGNEVRNYNDANGNDHYLTVFTFVGDDDNTFEVTTDIMERRDSCGYEIELGRDDMHSTALNGNALTEQVNELVTDIFNDMAEFVVGGDDGKIFQSMPTKEKISNAEAVLEKHKALLELI